MRKAGGFKLVLNSGLLFHLTECEKQIPYSGTTYVQPGDRCQNTSMEGASILRALEFIIGNSMAEIEQNSSKTTRSCITSKESSGRVNRSRQQRRQTEPTNAAVKTSRWKEKKVKWRYGYDLKKLVNDLPRVTECSFTRLQSRQIENKNPCNKLSSGIAFD
ncbi:hypothetical protein T265_02736 [Opisthorchis viverrini]|uniref:Uncharacterized protein n=1 Tax=Opisthorchis viverrini TaxID=6198 RepID=A0A074ZY58_OPIVI|nr:hypothetical protein T265_02736 [Opisthorchis viverrini]KER30922.1 hypothetical protein T265_02736 [Opisthorchis viverrini]